MREIPKAGVLEFDRPKVRYVSGKDDSSLADIDTKETWGKLHLQKWLENRVKKTKLIEAEEKKRKDIKEFRRGYPNET